QVDDEEIDPPVVPARQRDGFLRESRRQNLKPFAAQRQQQDLAQGRFVLDEQKGLRRKGVGHGTSQERRQRIASMRQDSGEGKTVARWKPRVRITAWDYRRGDAANAEQQAGSAASSP